MEQELYHALKAIESRDPDGGEREPTEAAYLYHEKWAVEPPRGLFPYPRYPRAIRPGRSHYKGLAIFAILA
jgi:hypothetical protein